MVKKKLLGHSVHICKKCSSLPQERKNELLEVEITGDTIFDDADIDCLPVFSEKKKFSELDNYEKMLLRDYIYSEITEHRELSGRVPSESELVEIKKRMIIFLEEEQNISLKNDATLRQFFQANATNIINKLQKKKEDSQ